MHIMVALPLLLMKAVAHCKHCFMQELLEDQVQREQWDRWVPRGLWVPLGQLAL